MATIAEVRARRAAELAEEKRQQEESEAKQRANLLAQDRASLESSLAGLDLDYTLADGEAVALIEGYRVRKINGLNSYAWHVSKGGHSVSVAFWNGTDRLDYLLEAMDSVEGSIAYSAEHPQQPEPVAEIVVTDGVAYLLNDRLQIVEEVQTETDAAAFIVEERVIDLEKTVATLVDLVNRLQEAQPGYDASDPTQNPWIISADEAERLLALKNGSLF